MQPQRASSKVSGRRNAASNGASKNTRRRESVRLACCECGNHFNRSIGPRVYSVACPKCHSRDTEVE